MDVPTIASMSGSIRWSSRRVVAHPTLFVRSSAQQIKKLNSPPAPQPMSIEHDVRPETIKYTKSKWDDRRAFTSFSLDHLHQVQEKYAEAIEALKEEARSMLLLNKGNTKRERLVLIDTLERLGVAYHFEQEIEDQLQQIFKSDHHSQKIIEEEDDDLFVASLQFRLLRQHRYHASSGDLDKLIKCENNKFREAIESDAKGLLSLYEAAHLRIHGEEILDEAVTFSVHHLRRMVKNQLDSPLQEQVKRALQQPLHRGIPRIETRHYISFYQKLDSKNEMLLKLAKLNFNYLQNIYKNELCQLSRWWNELKWQLPYARSRLVETYLWGTAFYFKPRYSYARVAVAKMSLLMTVVDDTYDNYATVEEADIFTEALQRWSSIEEIDNHQLPAVPDYMRIVYKTILRVYDDYEREAGERGKQFAVCYAKETMKEICKAYNKELKWFTRSVPMPSFKDYIATRTISSCFYVICAGTIPGMKSASKETVDWLRSEPKIVKAAGLVCRYLDDLGSYERESKNGEALTGMDIYMRQHVASKQETENKFMELAEDAWKDLNTEWLAIDYSVPKDLLEQAVGYARGAEMFCRSCEDGYTKPEILGGNISALFVDPITI